MRLAYPDFEVIVVDDGSTDASADIARAHGAILVETEHRGLSSARNAGIERARGEVVAFLDDDAYPDSGLAPLRGRVPAGQRPRRGGRAEHPARRRRPGRRLRRPRPRRADPRPDLRPRGRARARLQHGLPQIGAGGDRRLRRAVPRRRRRRRRVLAPAGIGPDTRLQRRRRRHAPPPRLRAPLPPSSSTGMARRRRCWSASGRAATTGRLLALVGADLRLAGDGDDPQAGDGPLRHLGQRPLPVDLRAGPRDALEPAADAGVPAADRRARGSLGAGPALGAPALRLAAVRCGGLGVAVAGARQRLARQPLGPRPRRRWRRSFAAG